MVTVLSQVESQGEVGMNSTAAAASAGLGSGIDPVSKVIYWYFKKKKKKTVQQP